MTHAERRIGDSPATNRRSPGDSRWAVVLAGGEGERMRPFVRTRLGKDIPKQYCTFTGSRSMLQHTVDRASSLVSQRRVVAMIGPGQRGLFENALSRPFHGRVIEQPSNRGTLAAVFAAAAYVAAEDAEATLVITPSDGYVHPEDEFLTAASLAILYAERFPSRVVLLGAAADSPETDYGWIEPFGNLFSAYIGPRLSPVSIESFHEKPSAARADRLLRSGCLWNTMIGAVKLQALWRLGWKAAPNTMEAFDRFRTRGVSGPAGALSESERSRNLAGLFAGIAGMDFSSDLLQRCPEDISVLPMRGVEWSDWGRPERVRTALESCACFMTRGTASRRRPNNGTIRTPD